MLPKGLYALLRWDNGCGRPANPLGQHAKAFKVL